MPKLLSIPGEWLVPDAEKTVEREISPFLPENELTPSVRWLDPCIIGSAEKIYPYMQKDEIATAARFTLLQGRLMHCAGCLAAKLAAYDFSGKVDDFRSDSSGNGTVNENSESSSADTTAPNPCIDQEFRITWNKDGAPFLRGSGLTDIIEISITHIANAAVAVAWNRVVGIDVEDPGRAKFERWRRIIDRVCGSARGGILEMLAGFPEKEGAGQAARLWTALECGVKVMKKPPLRPDSIAFEGPGREVVVIKKQKKRIRVATTSYNSLAIGIGWMDP